MSWLRFRKPRVMSGMFEAAVDGFAGSLTGAEPVDKPDYERLFRAARNHV